MQNKRRLLKRLLKEVLSEDKRFLINESWNNYSWNEIEKEESKQTLQKLYNALEREGLKGIVSKLKAKKGVIHKLPWPWNVLYISLFEKNDIQTLDYKQHIMTIDLINKKTNEFGWLNDKGWIGQYIINGDYIKQIDYKFIEHTYFPEKPEIVTDKYWGMKALRIKPEGSAFNYVILYK